MTIGSHLQPLRSRRSPEQLKKRSERIKRRRLHKKILEGVRRG